MKIDEQTKKKARKLKKGQNNFFYFSKNIFGESFDSFISGDYVKECCKHLQNNDRSMRLAFRSGFKSTSLYSFVLWKIMYEGSKKDLDIRYFSYNQKMAAHHIQEIKRLMKTNSYFDDFNDYKPQADNILEGSWTKKGRKGNIIKLRPVGIVSFSRGLKSDLILLDDIYADPENPISPTAVLKVNDIFRGIITESVNREGEIHFVGTPMSNADAVWDPDIQERFDFKKFPAIQTNEEGEEIPTWPEYYTLKEIKDKISVMGEKRFQKEMMCSPVHSEDAFFKRENLRKEVVDSDLNNIPLEQGYETSDLVVAGWDLGKKRHPSSLSIFKLAEDRAIMLHHKFMKWPYYTGEGYDPLNPSQLEYCNRAIKNFGINTVYFDATRGELEGAKDLGILPTTYQGVVFNAKKKVELANEFEKTVINNRIELLEDEEMLKSICSMTNELKAVESGGQHADAFVSISLALIGLRKMNASSSGSEATTGDKSIFSEKSRIPRGW